MEISFKTQGDVQMVEIDGPMADAEAAAIRVKLEQKINQGRAKVLFDLSNFPLENDASRKFLVGILIYAINRGVLTVCCGVKSSQRPLLIVPGQLQPKVFFTRTEGVDFLSKNAPVDPKTKLAGARKTEEQLKEEAIQKVLERYEVFQHSDDDDPFRLQFLAEQYKVAPNRESLSIEKKAIEAFESVQLENKNLETECDKLARKLKGLMQYRKIPLSGKELQLKQTDLTREIEEMDQMIARLDSDLTTAKKAAEVAQVSVVETRKASEEAIRGLESHLSSTGESFTREAAELQKLDAQEQALFDARMKAP